MATQIKIRQFQSLKAVDLELTGFTVITGPSNIGKSAIVRAIGAALFGALGDYFIMDKPVRENQCAVAVVDGKTSIKWWKVRSGEGTPNRNTSLEVNGVKYTKFGKEQAELTKDLGFVELDIAGQRVRPQIATQFDPIFLLSGSDTEAAEVLKLLGRVDVITEAQRLAAKDARATQSKLDVRTEDKTTAKLRLLELEKVPEKEREHSLMKVWVIKALARSESLNDRLQAIREIKQLRLKQLPKEMKQLPIPTAILIREKIGQLKSLKPKVIPEKGPVQVSFPLMKAIGITLIKEYDRTVNEQDKLHQQWLNSTGELEALRDKKKEMEKELGRCPLCERTFN